MLSAIQKTGTDMSACLCVVSSSNSTRQESARKPEDAESSSKGRQQEMPRVIQLGKGKECQTQDIVDTEMSDSSFSEAESSHNWADRRSTLEEE